METGGARVLVAAEDVVPDSEEVAAEDVVPDTEEALDSVIAPDSVDLLQSVEALDSVIAPDSVEMVPDSVEMVPDSLPPGAFLCPHCNQVHEDRESWNRVHSRFWPCSRCGLVHYEYMVFAMIHGLDEFGCEVFIPDPNNIVMHGDSVVIPPHVLKMLDDKLERERSARKDDNCASVRMSLLII